MSDEPKSKNIHWHAAEVTQEQRETLIGQKGCVLWFTGLSGSGKSTIARRVEQKLLSRHIHAYSLDGDNVRHGLNKDLGFSPEDRTENIRRIGAVAQLFADAGTVTTASFISPYRAGRDAARERLPEGRFIEVFVNTSLEECERRDPKGLYKKARSGEIPNFTGISAPYEEPLNAEIVMTTEERSIDECADQVIAFLEQRGYIPAA
ncbi:MAG: adenylyl-sulfate kinase [Myxococcota bacterium]